MKKLIMGLALVVGLGSAAQAQNIAKAKEILGKVSTKYKSYNTIKADFKYTMEIPSEKMKEEQKGTFYLKKNKFRVEMKDQTLICDSKNLWTYVKDANEVQINNYDPKAMDINPTEIFTMYEKGFLYAYMGDEQLNGKPMSLIELTPNDKKQSFFKVKLYVDKTNSIVRSKIYEKNGNIYTYDITNLLPNSKLDDSYFTFNKATYPKVSVVDLRTGH